MRGSRRSALTAVLIASFVLNAFHLNWGLPHSNTTWAADAVAPLTPLSIAQKSFSRLNSGWFYFKYPIGHALVMLAAYAPVLGTLYVLGDFRHPQGRYPYGFTQPERSLSMLAFVGRLISVVMATAIVWTTYEMGLVLFGPTAALLAAAGTATSVALVYYAHTTNLDVPLTFWMILAVWFGLRLMYEVRWYEAVGLGIASGMAFATKESAVGFLIALPPCIVIAQLWQQRPWSWARFVPIGARLGGGALLAIVTYALASNALYNPTGFVNRWRFLTGTLPSEFFGKMVPRAAYIDVTHAPGLATHVRLLRELFVSLSDAVGAPLLLAAVCGIPLAFRRQAAASGLMVLLAVTYYWFALTSLPLVAVRYVLPLIVPLMLFAGVALAALCQQFRTGRVIVVALLLFTFARAATVDYLLLRDPRYAAERWLQEHARGRTVEYYNRAPYLPRFPEGVRAYRPKFAEITLRGLSERNPELIVLSTPNLETVVERYDTFEIGAHQRPENEEFLQALLAGRTEYRSVARFRARSPLLRDGMIRTLNPEIVVFARS